MHETRACKEPINTAGNSAFSPFISQLEILRLPIAGWQEAFRAEGSDASAPLLGKPTAAEPPLEQDNNKPKNETETIKALLRMSAVDTPLLMLAFAAGMAVADVV